MIALIFLLISLAASFSLVHRISSKLPILLKIPLSVIISVIGSTWLAIGIIALAGYQLGLAVLFVIFTGLLIKFHPDRKILKSIRFSNNFALYIGISLLIFALLFDRAFLKPVEGSLQTVMYSYGDIALHSTYINYFAEQSSFSLRSPIFPQETFTYPFFINFYTALLVKMGWSVRVALVISSLLIIVAAMISLYHLAYNITKRRITPYFTAILLLLNGGLGGAAFFKDWSHSTMSLNNFITHLPVDYSHIKELDYFWSNIVTTHLLPQRGFLVGFSTLLVFIATWQWLWKEKNISWSLILMLSMLVGFLPLFHTHSYLVLCPLLVWFTGWLWRFKKIKLTRLLWLIAPAIVIGAVQLFFLSTGKNFISFQLGWMVHESSFIGFWWQNMGVYLLLLLVTPFLFVRFYPDHTFEKLLLIPTLAIVVICNIFIFQPNEWDNMKFFMLSHTLMAIITAAVFTHFWNKAWKKIVIIFLLLITCWSGSLSLLYIYHHPVTIATEYDVAISQVIKQTPSDSVFLTADTHNHLVPMLGGRTIVLGYRGWLWTHGLDYSQTEKDVSALYQGVGAQHLIKKYGIDYIFIGQHEKKLFNVNEDFFSSNYEIYYQDNFTSIYQVKAN